MKITITLDETEATAAPRAITLSLVPLDDHPDPTMPATRTVDLTIDDDGFRTLVDPKAAR